MNQSREVFNTRDTKTFSGRKTPDPRLRAIRELDLRRIRAKLAADPHGPRWDAAKAEHVELEYKRFLQLICIARERRAIVPMSHDVDTFWHYHILDTRKYAADCEHVFGRFVHHFPYFGMRGSEDAANLRTAYASTLELYRRTFGEQPIRVAANCNPACGDDPDSCTPEPSCSGEPSPVVNPRLVAA